ncbi:MAG: hypothetical protein LBR07_09275 [Puniceicoccales bacterium]|jgi:hypothetical protein|nr:hypothetical protein [Puniceicoccales bacterium]
MISALRWLPALFCALLWAWLPELVRPAFSAAGLALWTDAGLLLLPALSFPARPACAVVLAGALCADAARGGPFGLSASVLLPVLLVLIHFRPVILRWSAVAWLGFITCLNTVLALVTAALWTADIALTRHAATGIAWFGGGDATDGAILEWTPLAGGALLLSAVAGAVASSLLVLALGHWFIAFQVALAKMTGGKA